MGGKHHGFKGTRIYNIWCSMKRRCLSKNSQDYHRYGARGITVCDRWMRFVNFLADMGEPPEGMSIERVNNDLGYEPGNCVWATQTEQAFNRRSNRVLTINGVSKPMSLWADEYGIPRATLRQRITGYGWDPERAVTTPLQRQGKKLAYCDANSIPLTETRNGGFIELQARAA